MDNKTFDGIQARQAKLQNIKGKTINDKELMEWSEEQLSDALRYGEPTGSTTDAIKRVLALKAERGKPAAELLVWQKTGIWIAAIAALAAVAKLFVGK